MRLNTYYATNTLLFSVDNARLVMLTLYLMLLLGQKQIEI